MSESLSFKARVLPATVEADWTYPWITRMLRSMTCAISGDVVQGMGWYQVKEIEKLAMFEECCTVEFTLA